MTAPYAKSVRQHHEIRAGTYLFFFFFFAAVIYAAHLSLLRLPFYWDELAQFIPAALDILKDNAWVAKSTVPNVHPPGVMAYLAGVWRVFGYSIVTTRVAMLLLASFGVLFTFVLAMRLSEKLAGIPALVAVLLLMCDPLFYTQSMMAQLDMPAMVFCLMALILFFEDRHRGCALACTAAVFAKETSIILPLVLVAVLFREGRLKQYALYYALPFAVLGIWLLALWGATGTPFGNRGFASYNITYALHPVRAAVSILRRLYYLLFDNFRWVGTIAAVLAWRRHDIYESREWRITMAFAAVYVLFVSLLGGAELERYLMPVLPLYYIAVAAAFSTVPMMIRNIGILAMAGGLITGLFVNTIFPFPPEDNLAMVDFVELQQNAAQFLETGYQDKAIYTASPFTNALLRPELGYVQQPLKVHETYDLRPTMLARLDPAKVDVLVLYSRTWDPPWSVMRIPAISKFLAKFYDYEPQMTPAQCKSMLGVERVHRWDQRGQWIEVYAKPSVPQNHASMLVPRYAPAAWNQRR